jgi:hypothetical protein
MLNSSCLYKEERVACFAVAGDNRCDTDRDGYYGLVAASTVVGIVWLYRYTALVKKLEARPTCDWTATLDENSDADSGDDVELLSTSSSKKKRVTV